MAKVIDQVITDKYALYQGDCVEVVKGIPDDSIGFSIFSPPFASLFVYSNSYRDMGNSKSDEEFWNHFRFLIPELYRVMKSGRNIAVHCANIPAMKFKDGYIGLKDFRGDIIRAFQAEGFIYHSEVCIWKDPLIEATRTKSKGLMYKQVKKDSAQIKQGTPDYLVVVKKPGENPDPIENEEGSIYDYDFIGEDGPKRSQTEQYSHEVWRRYASPVWMDIRQSNTLNFRIARSNKDERHICPLQLDVIERALFMWSKKGDVVLSPFAGIGSEVYQAVRMGRFGIGIELKESYFNTCVNNMSQIIRTRKRRTLF